jgi:Flp pilus assembly pilin Flp
MMNNERIRLGCASMRDLCRRLLREEAGQDLTEYALLLVLIALAAVTSMKSVANGLINAYSKTAANLATT